MKGGILQELTVRSLQYAKQTVKSQIFCKKYISFCLKGVGSTVAVVWSLAQFLHNKNVLCSNPPSVGAFLCGVCVGSVRVLSLLPTVPHMQLGDSKQSMGVIGSVTGWQPVLQGVLCLLSYGSCDTLPLPCNPELDTRKKMDGFLRQSADSNPQRSFNEAPVLTTATLYCTSMWEQTRTK